jgi:hypothetical protein
VVDFCEHGNKLSDSMQRKETNCRFIPVGLVTFAVTLNNPPHFCMGVPKLLFSSEIRCTLVHSSPYFNKGLTLNTAQLRCPHSLAN